MPGLEKILSGILKYQATLRPAMVHEFEKVKDNPEVCYLSMFCWPIFQIDIITRFI